MAFSSRFAFWEQKGSWISKSWFSYVLSMVKLETDWGMCVHMGVQGEWPVAGEPFSVLMASVLNHSPPRAPPLVS